MSDYRSESFSLTAAQEALPLVDPGTAIHSVTVRSLPAGANARLIFGQGRPEIPVVEGDKFADPRGCVIETDGLYLSNTAQPGVSIGLTIFFGPIEQS